MKTITINISTIQLNKTQYRELDKWLFDNISEQNGIKMVVIDLAGTDRGLILFDIIFEDDQDALAFTLRFSHAIHNNN